MTTLSKFSQAMNRSSPIGIFDSGLGGLSVFNEIHRLLPHEKTVYFADRKHAPYGLKSKEQIIARSFRLTEELLNLDAKIIVVACNTATTNAIKELRKAFDIPFIGIEPAIKPAAFHSNKNKVAVLATQGTLTSDLFMQTSKRFTQNVELLEIIGNGLVEAVENGQAHTEETRNLLKILLEPIHQKEVDYLVLGCTHYPFLIPLLHEMLPNQIKIIDSGKAVAKQTRVILEHHNQLALSAQGHPEFYTNTDKFHFKEYIKANSFDIRYKNF